MRRLLEPPVLLRILTPLILLPLLGLAARPHALAELQQQIGRARTFHAYPTLAKGLALVAEHQPWRLELLEQAGLYAYQGDDYETAIDLFEQASSYRRLSPLGHLYLGDAYRKTGDTQAAMTSWQMAKPGVSAEEVVRRTLEIHQEAADFQAVITDLQELAALRPADVSVRYRLGLHLAALQPEAALPNLAQVADLNPSLRPQTERLIQAIRSAQLTEDPAFTLLESGRALAVMGEWALAAEAFRGAAAADPKYAEAWAYLGEAKQQLAITVEKENISNATTSNTANAEKLGIGLPELKKALQLDPESLAGNTLMALYWQRQGMYDLALEYLNKVTAQYPNDPALQAQLGSSLALSGDLEAALKAYKRGVELAPRQAEPWRQLAGFCVLHEYLLREEGLPAARRAASIEPSDPANLDMLGQVLLLLEDFSTAQRFFRTALDVNPAYTPAQVHLGLVYALRGDTQQAYQAWKAVSATAPGTPAAEQAERLLLNYFP